MRGRRRLPRHDRHVRHTHPARLGRRGAHERYVQHTPVIRPVIAQDHAAPIEGHAQKLPATHVHRVSSAGAYLLRVGGLLFPRAVHATSRGAPPASERARHGQDEQSEPESTKQVQKPDGWDHEDKGAGR